MHLIKAPPGIRPGPVRDLDIAVRALLRFWRGLSERERLQFAEMFYRALPEDEVARDLEIALARYGAGLLHRYRAALLGNGSTVVLTFTEHEDQPAVIDAGASRPSSSKWPEKPDSRTSPSPGASSNAMW